MEVDIVKKVNGAIDTMKDQLTKNEDLYNEVHDQFDKFKKEGNIGSSRNLLEAGKLLVSIRTNGITAANNIINGEKTVSEIKLKDKAIDTKQNSDSDLEQLAIKMIKKSIDEEEINRTAKSVNNGAEMLENVINEKLNDDSIKLFKNDKNSIDKFKK